MRYILILILLSLVNPVYMDVPAVRGDHEGEMVRIYVEEVNGSGGVYVSVMPTAGTFFQDSINTVLNLVDVGDRTLLVRTNVGEGSIDGPSAGLALYTLFRSLVEGKRILPDRTLTGAVDNSGRALPVGGVYEKLYVSALTKKSLGVAPTEEHFDESLLILGEMWNTSVCFIDSTEEAYVFMTEGECSEREKEERTPISPKYESTYFKEQSYLLLRELPEDHPAWDLYREGLYYSAGNEAFLDITYGEIRKGLTAEHRDKLVKELKKCLSRVDPHRAETFEDYLNADMRVMWAEEVLGSMSNRTDPPGLAEDIVQLKRGILWCEVARSLEGKVSNRDWEVMATRILREEGREATDHPGAELMEIIYNSKELPPEGYAPRSPWARMMYNHAEYLGDPSLKAMAYKEDRIINRVEGHDNNLFLGSVFVILIYGYAVSVARRWVLGRR